MKIKILSFFLLSIWFIQSQEHGPSQTEESLEEQFWESIQNEQAGLDSLVVWQEQVLLHVDKQNILPKDYLFFKAYVLTGPEQLRVSASEVLKVELLDENGELVQSQYHKIENGASEGSFMIPKKVKSGKHYLRAYTRWMLNYGPENFATKELEIRNKRGSLNRSNETNGNIQFYPEGNTFIAGLENRVAVKIEDYKGEKIGVYDEQGNKVTHVQTYTEGLGTFRLQPNSSMNYFLQLEDGQRIPLPEVGATGYVMQVNPILNEKVVVKIAASEELKKQEVFLRGKVNGSNFFETKVLFTNKNSSEIDIPKSDLPNGIVHLVLEDEFEQEWASRSIHIDNNQLHFEVERISDAEKDLVKIKVLDANGQPVETDLSVALGETSDGNKYFEVRNQRYVNDLLLLTNGVPEDYVLNRINQLPSVIQYNFQEGLEFYGRAYDMDGVPLMNTKVQVIISGKGEAIAQEVITNEEGLFQLDELQIEGEADMVFRRGSDEQRDRFVKVIPYEYETPPLQLNDDVEISTNGLSSKQFIPKKQVAEFKSFEGEEKLITLEGVTLIGEKYKSYRTPSVYNIEPKHVVFQDPKKPKFISELFFNIPGVIVSGSRDFPTLGIINRGGTVSGSGDGPLDSPGPIWLIDGVNIGTSLFFDPDWGLNYTDIDRIEILESSEASLWGSRANQGVIAIYTRNGSDAEYLNRKNGQLTFSGYHNSLSFETYRNQILEKNRKMENSIVYWNPSLKTDANGEAYIPISLDDNQTIQIDIKAITPEGRSGSMKSTF